MITIKEKPKKPYILKLKHHRTQQSQQIPTNVLYEFLKTQSQYSKKFKTLQDEKDFYIKLDQIIQRQPAKVIGKQLGIVQARKKLQKRRKCLQKAALQPKKSYQNYTECLFHRLPKRRTKSNFQYEQWHKKNKNISKSSTGFVRTITNDSLVPQNITISFKKQSQKSLHHRPASSNHSYNPPNQFKNQNQSEQYNKAFHDLIKNTKSCSSSIFKEQKRLNMMGQLHQKIYKHFDKLAINQIEMDNIEFDDMSAITKVERYKFNTNNFLQNILLKKDSAAKEWIDKENKKQFRKNTIEIVRQKLTDDILRSKCIKYRQKNTQISKSIDKKKQHQTKSLFKFKSISSQKMKYSKPKRIKDFMNIKVKF